MPEYEGKPRLGRGLFQHVGVQVEHPLLFRWSCGHVGFFFKDTGNAWESHPAASTEWSDGAVTGNEM